jgi:hypothetical protein
VKEKTQSVIAAVCFGAAFVVAAIAALTDGNGRLVAASVSLVGLGLCILSL